MCTVSFIPLSAKDFIFTSNRDEDPGRDTLQPKIYWESEVKLLFPKDAVAGGTWIGLSDRKRLACILNGGFTAHKREEQYRMSRGILVTEVLTAEAVKETIEEYNFKGIEPFTLLVVDWKFRPTLLELVWDGNIAHFSEKPWEPMIWSSSLLYSEDVKKQREHWFVDFLDQTESVSKENILTFHHQSGEGNPETNLIMNRGFVKTKSISQIAKQEEDIIFRYEDIDTRQISLHPF